MLKFNSQTLFDFNTYIDILLLDDVPFSASWISNEFFKRYTYFERVLTIHDSVFGTRQLLITDSFLKNLRDLYHNIKNDLFPCVLNQKK